MSRGREQMDVAIGNDGHEQLETIAHRFHRLSTTGRGLSAKPIRPLLGIRLQRGMHAKPKCDGVRFGVRPFKATCAAATIEKL